MGFDLQLAERAYNKLLSETGGDHSAITSEQIIELILSNTLNNATQEESNSIMHGDEEKTDFIECSICRMDRNESEMHRAACGHNYCKICLERHYKSSIENGIVSFVCMHEECERVIDKNELFLFLSESHKVKYDKFVRNMALAKDPNVRWCVKAECDNPIRRKSKKQTKLECDKCGTVICFECAGLWYNDTTKRKHRCHKNEDKKLVSDWAKSQQFDVQFCPKCAARIEKLSGCNHMKCSYCKYEFCWLCRKEFKKGHYDASNILFGCPNGENATKRPSKCSACCILTKARLLMCCLPLRICWWRMNEQGVPWCCCWCCCQD